MRIRTLLAAPLLCLALGASSRYRQPRTDVPYPEGFAHWTHVSSGLIGPASPAYPGFGGMHHIYANAEAMRGYASGHFLNGSVLVFDVFHVSTTGDVTSQTTRRQVDVMMKDSERFAASGGWGFDEFAGDSRERNSVVQANCSKCHSSRPDYVFSQYRP